MKKQLILFSFVFILVISSFVFAEIDYSQIPGVHQPPEEITIIKTQQNMQQAIDEKARTVTYTFSSSDSAIEVQKKSYWSVVPASENNKAYVKTDDKGNLIEADLTASKETSWTFGQETLKVPEGARVVFKDGKIEIFGKENQQVSLTDKTSGEELKSSLTLGKESVSIENGVISGKNFQVGDIKVQSGSLSLAKDGYVLGKNSLADWKGLTLENGKDLFLATSESAYHSHSGSSIFPEDLRLSGKGEDFTIKFKEGNSFAHIDPKDNFEIKAGKGFEFSLENRDSSEKIPLMNTKGEFIINENSKSIYTREGKVLATRKGQDVLFNKETTNKDSSTSPIELRTDGQNSKYIVSNFKGIASVLLDAEEGKADERYANSIYWKRASVENRYNYPTEESLLTQHNKKLLFGKQTFDGFVPLNIDEQTKTQIVRELLDYLETLPEGTNKDLPITIRIADKNSKGSSYDQRDNSINLVLTGSSLWGIDEEIGGIGTIRHEIGHLYTDFIQGSENTYKRLVQDRLKLVPNPWISGEMVLQDNPKLEQDYKKLWLSSTFYQEWSRVNSEKGWTLVHTNPDSYRGASWNSNLKLNDNEPAFGYINAYGAFGGAFTPRKGDEDMSTYLEKVVGDPAFFKRNNLIGENADTRYAQKLELLKNYGLITPQEYDAVMHPEKYFTQEELTTLLRKN